MVQWLKRSPKTREVVSSSLNSDWFFLFVFFHFIACIDVELFKDRKVSFICYKMSFSVCFFCVCIFYFFFVVVVFVVFFFCIVSYLLSNFITVLGLVKCYPLSVAESSSCINDCATCLCQFPDPAKVYDPAEDYILSLHQHFSIHQQTSFEGICEDDLAASVTHTLFELCSDVIRG